MNFDIFDQEPDADVDDKSSAINETTPQIMDYDETKDKEDADLPYIPLLKESPKMENSMPYIKSPQNPKPKSTKLDVGSVKHLMENINNISKDTRSEGDQYKNESLNIVIENFYKTVKYLQEVDMWVPDSKETLIPKLKAIASPIANALSLYTKELEKFK